MNRKCNDNDVQQYYITHYTCRRFLNCFENQYKSFTKKRWWVLVTSNVIFGFRSGLSIQGPGHNITAPGSVMVSKIRENRLFTGYSKKPASIPAVQKLQVFMFIYEILYIHLYLKF